MKTFLFYAGCVVGIWAAIMLTVFATVLAIIGMNTLLQSWGM